MDSSSLQGIYFGLTEGTVTTMGIIIGMFASMPIKKAIFSAVIAATLSDSLGDSIGLYYSEEARGGKNAINAVMNMVLCKLLVSFIYIIPLFFIKSLKTGIFVSILIALLVIYKSFHNLASIKEVDPTEFIIKNTLTIVAVIIITYYIINVIKRFLK